VKSSRKWYQAEGERRGVKVTYHSFAYAGQEEKPVALKEMQKYKSLGERGGQVLPCLHFIGRTPHGKV